MTELQRTLNRLLMASNKSVTQVATLGQLDRAYVMRLFNGTKDNPSLETLMRLWIGLCMDAEMVKRDPTMLHGLALLVRSAAMSTAPSKMSGEK